MFNGTIQQFKQKASSKAENFKILKILLLEKFTMEFALKFTRSNTIE